MGSQWREWEVSPCMSRESCGRGSCPVPALLRPFLHFRGVNEFSKGWLAKVTHALPTYFFQSRLTGPCASLCCAGTSDPTFYCMGASSSASGGGHAVRHVGAVSAASFRNTVCGHSGTSNVTSVIRPQVGRRVASFFRLMYCSRERLGDLLRARGDWPTSRMAACHYSSPLWSLADGHMCCALSFGWVFDSGPSVENF